MPLVIVPLTSLATGHIGPQQSGSASALYNMFRNLGGSIGIALLATQLDLREKFHSVRLGEAINAFSPAASERLDALTRQFMARGAEAVAAGQQALGAVAGVVRREAFVMAYGDCFYLAWRVAARDGAAGVVLPGRKGRSLGRALDRLAYQGLNKGSSIKGNPETGKSWCRRASCSRRYCSNAGKPWRASSPHEAHRAGQGAPVRFSGQVQISGLKLAPPARGNRSGEPPSVERGAVLDPNGLGQQRKLTGGAQGMEGTSFRSRSPNGLSSVVTRSVIDCARATGSAAPVPEKVEAGRGQEDP